MINPKSRRVLCTWSLRRSVDAVLLCACTLLALNVSVARSAQAGNVHHFKVHLFAPRTVRGRKVLVTGLATDSVNGSQSTGLAPVSIRLIRVSTGATYPACVAKPSKRGAYECDVGTTALPQDKYLIVGTIGSGRDESHSPSATLIVDRTVR